MRVLDIDLDFFIEGRAHDRQRGEGRLDVAYYPPWAVDDALTFLERRCGLTQPIPGWATEQHADVFDRWRDAIALGLLVPPLSVTHVDAHADLGLGDAAYMYVMTELLLRPVEERTNPQRGGESGLADGNWLMFAIACRWLSDLTYVHVGDDDGRPGDLLEPIMAGFDLEADHIELASVTRGAMRAYIDDMDIHPPTIHLEPRVRLRCVPWQTYKADAPFDFVCLTRSPEFTPADADPIYDAIRERFVAEVPLPASTREEERRQSRDW